MDVAVRVLALLVLTCHTLPVIVYAQSGDDVKTLLTQLFITNAYNYKVRPIKNQTLGMDVDVEFYLSAIIEFDEQNENVKTSGYLFLYWTDEYLTWTPASHNNIQEIFIPQDDLWKPDVSLRNTFKTFKGLGSSYLNVRVYYDGTIWWRPFQVLESTCAVDITYFPFDTQLCEMKFTAWSYTKTDVNLNIGTKGILLDDYSTNNQWRLAATSARETNTDEAAVFFSVELKRKPSFYVINIIIPVILLTVLNCFTFLLPISSGERASFGITVFLSLAVFLTIVASELPKNSENTSLLSTYLMLMSGLSTSIVIACLIQARIAARTVEEDPISRPYIWLLKAFRFVRCKTCRKSRVAAIGDETIGDEYLERKTTGNTVAIGDGNMGEEDKVVWMDIVNALDFFFFWIFLLFSVICTTFLFGLAITNS